MPAVINAVKADLDKATGKSSTLSSSSTSPDATVLMECMAELYVPSFGLVYSLNSSNFDRYTANRQPGKALHFYLRLRRPDVFDLIKENNLFTDVQDQILLLVEFDHELMEKRKKEGWLGLGGGGKDEPSSEAIRLLVDNYHSIPVRLSPFLIHNLTFVILDHRSSVWCNSCRKSLIISSSTWILSSERSLRSSPASQISKSNYTQSSLQSD